MFVDFYGEKHKDYISQTINSINFVFPDQMPDEEIENFDILGKMRRSFINNIYLFKDENDDAAAYCQGILDGHGAFKKYLVLHDKFSDHELIHELNHLLEMRLIESDEERIKYFTGFDVVDEKYDETNSIPCPYKAINETVNDFITLKLMEHKKALNIEFSSSKYIGSPYDFGTQLSQKFFEYFLPELKEYRISGKPEQFKELIGEKEFNELASNLTTIVNFGRQNFIDIKNQIEEKTGKELTAKELVYNARMLAQLDLDEEYKSVLLAIANHLNQTKQILDLHKESELQ